MSEWPEFVTESEGRDDERAREPSTCLLTGWETVIFVVEEDYFPESSTAALAP